MKFSKNRKCKDYTCAIIPKRFFGENIGSGDQKHAFTTYIRDILDKFDFLKIRDFWRNPVKL